MSRNRPHLDNGPLVVAAICVAIAVAAFVLSPLGCGRADAQAPFTFSTLAR